MKLYLPSCLLNVLIVLVQVVVNLGTSGGGVGSSYINTSHSSKSWNFWRRGGVINLTLNTSHSSKSWNFWRRGGVIIHHLI